MHIPHLVKWKIINHYNICSMHQFGLVVSSDGGRANSEWVLLPCAAPAYDITNWVPPKTKYRVR